MVTYLTQNLNHTDIFVNVIGMTTGGSNTVHIYKQTIRRTTQLTNWEECGPCPVFASYNLAFALQLRKKHGKPQSLNYLIILRFKIL